MAIGETHDQLPGNGVPGGTAFGAAPGGLFPCRAMQMRGMPMLSKLPNGSLQIPRGRVGFQT